MERYNYQKNKVEKYVNLVFSRDALLKASPSIIRKKRSPLARAIANRNLSAITKAACDRIRGSLPPEKLKQFCSLLCEFRRKLKDKDSKGSKREVVAWMVSGLIGLVDAASGLIISFLWIIRKNLFEFLCGCKLDGICESLAK